MSIEFGYGDMDLDMETRFQWSNLEIQIFKKNWFVLHLWYIVSHISVWIRPKWITILVKTWNYRIECTFHYYLSRWRGNKWQRKFSHQLHTHTHTLQPIIIVTCESNANNAQLVKRVNNARGHRSSIAITIHAKWKERLYGPSVPWCIDRMVDQKFGCLRRMACACGTFANCSCVYLNLITYCRIPAHKRHQ